MSAEVIIVMTFSNSILSYSSTLMRIFSRQLSRSEIIMFDPGQNVHVSIPFSTWLSPVNCHVACFLFHCELSLNII